MKIQDTSDFWDLGAWLGYTIYALVALLIASAISLIISNAKGDTRVTEKLSKVVIVLVCITCAAGVGHIVAFGNSSIDEILNQWKRPS